MVVFEVWTFLCPVQKGVFIASCIGYLLHFKRQVHLLSKDKFLHTPVLSQDSFHQRKCCWWYYILWWIVRAIWITEQALPRSPLFQVSTGFIGRAVVWLRIVRATHGWSRPACGQLFVEGWLGRGQEWGKRQEEQQERGTGHALNDGGHDGLMDRLWPGGWENVSQFTQFGLTKKLLQSQVHKP